MLTRLEASHSEGRTNGESGPARAYRSPVKDQVSDLETLTPAETLGSEPNQDVVHLDLTSGSHLASGTEGVGSVLDLNIPRDRRLALARGQELPDRTSGAVLFADISHFTTLSESLVEALGSQRGAEELSRRVNAVLENVIREVHRYGGSVIGFAGDGLTCWFNGDNGRRATAAALAVQDLQRASAVSQTSDSASLLAMKIVVTAGLARRFLVGVPRIQRFDVLAGGILDRMSKAEGVARAGEVLVGGEIVGWIRDALEVIDWRNETGAVRKTPSDQGGEWFAVVSGSPGNIAEPAEPVSIPRIPREMARAWVLPLIFQRIERGEGQLVAESRQVAVLFVRFGGIQYDFDNEAGNKLGEYIEWVQKVLAPLGAFIMQIIVGDKGSYFYASFGAPLAHEDDLMRALRAGEELLRVPPALDFITTTSVGISEGKMHAGIFGGSGRNTYGVLGRAANVAAGLMEQAESGQVLVTPSVAEAASGFYDFHRLARGDGEIYELGGRKTNTQVLAPKGRLQTEFVGRAHERSRLRASLDALLQGQSDVVVIEGPPGIGKSRLLIELKDQAEALAISTFVGAGNAIEAETPFHAWKTIFAGILGITANSDEAAVRAALERHLANAPRLLELAPLLNPVLPAKLPENELTARMPPDARSENALEVMVGCLERPVGTLGVMLLILDDAQWLDSGSSALVEAAHRHHPSLLIALAMRPTEPDARSETETRPLSKFRSLLVDRQEDVLRLEALGSRDLIEVIRLYLGVNDLPSNLTLVVLDRAEGNPFFAQEVVDALIQRGLVRIHDGTCEVLGTAEQLSAEFPERIEKLIISRLDHLPSDHRTSLMVASVLGRSFSLQMMADVHPSKVDLETLRSQMEGLVGLGLVALDHEEPDLVYRFRHGLTHQAASELVPGSLRGEILGKAARWIETTQGANLMPFWPVLARYWDAAGDVSKSLVYLDLAGASAVATGAYEEAITFYTRAINLTDEHDTNKSVQVAGWHLRLGEIYVHRQSDDVTKGAENLETGLHTLGFGLPRGRVVQGLAISWQLMLQVWYRLTAARREPRSEGVPLLLEASRAYERLVEVYYISGKTLPSLYAALRSLNLAEAAGPSPELTRGWATFGALLGFVPLRRMAARYLDRALAAVDPSDPSAEAWAALVAGFYYSGLGQWSDAEAQTEKVVVLSQQIGDGRRLEDGLSNLMFQAYLRGDLTRGLELADDLQGRAAARHADRPLAYCLQGRSYCLLNLGQIEEARQAIDELEDLQARDPRPTDQALLNDTLGLKALSELYRGNLRQATSIAEILLTRISKGTPSNFSTLAAYQAPAEVYIDAWRHDVSNRALRRNARKSLDLLERYARVFPIGKPSLLRWEGVYEELRGRHQRAIRRLELSLAESTRLGTRLDEARTLRELVGVLDSADPDVVGYQRRADEINQNVTSGSIATSEPVGTTTR